MWSTSPTLVVVVASAELPVVMSVPVTSGIVITRSAVGSVARSTVSFASAVEPSKIIDDTKLLPPVIPSTSVTRLLNWTLSSSRLSLGRIALASIAIIGYSLTVLKVTLFHASLTLMYLYLLWYLLLYL